jgi:hypothetical protein
MFKETRAALTNSPQKRETTSSMDPFFVHLQINTDDACQISNHQRILLMANKSPTSLKRDYFRIANSWRIQTNSPCMHLELS